GAPVAVDGIVPLYIRLIACLSVPIAKLAGFTGGAFMFCTREAFDATGGFSERLYWAEEGSFALALKREGRFVVLWQRVLTSGRRFRKISGLQMLLGGVRMVFSPLKMLTQRSSVEKIWYDSNRADDDKMPTSFGARLSNGVALLIAIDLITAPLWDFMPWSLTPLASPAGKIRFVNATFLCHVALFLWPVGAILVVNLLRQKRWAGSIHSMALIAFCLWNAWGATAGVIRIWTLAGRWLMRF